MAPRNDNKKAMNKGAWTAEEDRKLSEYIETHGAKRWRTVAMKSGLSRCGKSCRLRWLNYLRPNIKRGNISDDEEDLILRLHKLLGNRWSLIAGRLPGRTDNEIKNYWNSHLSKKINQRAKTTQQSSPTTESESPPSREMSKPAETDDDQITLSMANNPDLNFDVNEFFDFSTGGNWINNFLELDDDAWILNADKR